MKKRKTRRVFSTALFCQEVANRKGGRGAERTPSEARGPLTADCRRNCSKCGARHDPTNAGATHCWWCGDVVKNIERRHANYAKLFDGKWNEDELSDAAWLGLVGVPWLLAQLRSDRHDKSDGGNGDSDPRPDRVGPAKSALEFMFAEKPVPTSSNVVPPGDPLAKFFIGLFAQFMCVGLLLHGAGGLDWQNADVSRTENNP